MDIVQSGRPALVEVSELFQKENTNIIIALAHRIYIFPFPNTTLYNLSVPLLFFHAIPGKYRWTQEVMCLGFPWGCGNMALFALNKWTEQMKKDLKKQKKEKRHAYVIFWKPLAGFLPLLLALRCAGGGREERRRTREDRWPQSGDGGCGRPPRDRGPFTAASHL